LLGFSREFFIKSQPPGQFLRPVELFGHPSLPSSKRLAKHFLAVFLDENSDNATTLPTCHTPGNVDELEPKG
jgi:hypothetical protein